MRRCCSVQNKEPCNVKQGRSFVLLKTKKTLSTLLHLAHLVNPVKTAVYSELSYAQTITFETMRVAREEAKSKLKIDLLTAQFPEDHSIIPDYFHNTKDLELSVCDMGTFQKKKKFPLLKDL